MNIPYIDHEKCSNIDNIFIFFNEATCVLNWIVTATHSCVAKTSATGNNEEVTATGSVKFFKWPAFK